MWTRPAASDLWRAIDVYLGLAYAGEPPSAVRSRLESMRAAAPDRIYDLPCVERDTAAEPSRYSLRLGNRFYPHMKLVIERAPDGQGHLFRADTHDQHICPSPGSPEYGEFCKLMESNQRLAQSIERSWEDSGLPTFKSFLRRDLERRRGPTP